MREGYADYANVPSIIGIIVARRLATLHELQTVYSYRDALDMAEIIVVQNYNEWLAMENGRNG
ncbi:hypothetical protein LJC59_00330 [Desulfovibrio sp. OttesenSCG-928-A18]|nr:hypothetical protein [Desulfovibrio sp. OttesenSCG-928-A18]